MSVHERQIRLSLRILIYREADLWYGHCLDLDIVAEGQSPGEAVASCLDLCSTQIDYAVENGDIGTIFRPAQPELWHMFSIADDYRLGKELPKRIQKAEVRELAFA
ncbi:MAG: hypothetical protein HY288_01815 [Planctomycetia bacterium]|nr:hypothetical protein [Planctomycetia bacterium]